MSMIQNLQSIEADGLRRFVEQEKLKWICAGCGEPLCVHMSFCPACKRKWR
jgi:rubrerythrin